MAPNHSPRWFVRTLSRCCDNRVKQHLAIRFPVVSLLDRLASGGTAFIPHRNIRKGLDASKQAVNVLGAEYLTTCGLPHDTSTWDRIRGENWKSGGHVIEELVGNCSIRPFISEVRDSAYIGLGHEIKRFRARPHLFLGGAFVAGTVLAATVGRTSRVSRPSDRADFGSLSDSRVSAHAQALELWNNVKGALIGVAATQITKYISELIPGFDDHYQRITQRT
jgi:hypothetical protein